jgi:TrmH family RNA methyltransferase
LDSLITSFQNPKFKVLRSLKHRKYRRSKGIYLIEGIRFVEEALDAGAPLDSLVYAPELLVSPRPRTLIQRAAHIPHLRLAADLFGSLSDRDEPQGLAAVVRIQDRPLSDLILDRDLFVIVAYQLSDPGNLGAIIRTADAAGATGVIVVEPSVDLYDPRSVRATMGSLFALPIIRLQNGSALPPWYAQVRASGHPLLVAASSAHGQDVYSGVDYVRPLSLVIGSERHGLPPQVSEQADVVVRLPIFGRATSLNVSAAAAALIYEVVRQRHAKAVGPHSRQ